MSMDLLIQNLKNCKQNSSKRKKKLQNVSKVMALYRIKPSAKYLQHLLMKLPYLMINADRNNVNSIAEHQCSCLHALQYKHIDTCIWIYCTVINSVPRRTPTQYTLRESSSN